MTRKRVRRVADWLIECAERDVPTKLGILTAEACTDPYAAECVLVRWKGRRRSLRVHVAGERIMIELRERGGDGIIEVTQYPARPAGQAIDDVRAALRWWDQTERGTAP